VKRPGTARTQHLATLGDGRSEMSRQDAKMGGCTRIAHDSGRAPAIPRGYALLQAQFSPLSDVLGREGASFSYLPQG
jgi:hypothetical protein